MTSTAILPSDDIYYGEVVIPLAEESVVEPEIKPRRRFGRRQPNATSQATPRVAVQPHSSKPGSSHCPTDTAPASWYVTRWKLPRAPFGPAAVVPASSCTPQTTIQQFGPVRSWAPNSLFSPSLSSGSRSAKAHRATRLQSELSWHVCQSTVRSSWPTAK